MNRAYVLAARTDTARIGDRRHREERSDVAIQVS
jgi:hypothetical protein